MNFSRHRLWIIAAAILLIAVVFTIFRDSNNTTAPTSTATTEPATSSKNHISSRPTPTEVDPLLQAEGARTDVGLATFPISAYKSAPAPADKPSTNVVGSAFIHVPSAGRRLIYEPNQIGEFPAVETQLNDTVGVRLALDNVKTGTPVRVVIMDGGTFPTKEGVSQVIRTADWGGVAFEFTTSGNIGYHRMVIQAQGQPNRILNFSAHDPQTWPSPAAATAAVTK